jgi:hypothetical protein
MKTLLFGSFALGAADIDLSDIYPAHNFSVPVDHFHNESRCEPHNNESYNLRYWFDVSNYKPGGPVTVLQSGETSGMGRLSFLEKGIVAQLTEATHGIGVILEHRYYGTSFPTPDISTENLRFLPTEQALADQALFSKNIKSPELVSDPQRSPLPDMGCICPGSK